MCGIGGIFNLDGRPIERDLLTRMTDAMRHRGPDSAGFFVDQAVGLGMRRLSIIDLEGGHQPVFNETKSVAVVFNGEIFNYVELGRELELRGHRFATHSDTEVIVHLYEEFGVECLSRLNGMFALALWDLEKQKLFVARDRLGVKPLYYALERDRFAFASELKALLSGAVSHLSFDQAALHDFLALMYVRAPRTPFKEIRKLLPGHFIEISAQDFHVRCWWKVRDYFHFNGTSAEHAASETRKILSDAVRIRLRSDVPVGTFLSGGIDSSAITAFAAATQGGPVESFAVGFTETEFDELPYARMVANHCRTNHHETIVSIQDALNDLPRLIWHADEPHGDSALVPTFAVSRFAASHVRVILSGLGGDELFGGYGRYFDGYPSEHLYRRLPLGLRSIMTRLAQPFSAFAPHLLERFRLNSMYDADRYVAKISVFQKQMRERLLGCLDDETESLALMFDHLPNADAANRLMYVDLLSYLADDLLHITDRMTMAVSLEARTPFLDYRLVEFAAGLPSSHKLDWRNRNTKICLKAAVAPVLPEAILTRKKWGFGSPVSRWMENGLSDTVQALFRNSELVRLGLIETKAVQQYLRHPVPGEGRLRYQRLWSLLALEIWAVCFGKGQREKPGFGLADLT